MGTFIWKEITSWIMFGRWSEFRVVRVGGGYCEVGIGRVSVRREAGRRIEIEK